MKYRMFWSSWPIVIFPFLQLFYQVKGDMCLKIIENGKQKDIFIREGEVKHHCFSVIVVRMYAKLIFYEVYQN